MANSNDHTEGFKIVDKRMFTSEGELRDDFVAGDEGSRQEEIPVAPSEEEAQPEEREREPLPDPLFTELVHDLFQNAAACLQGLPDPATGQMVVMKEEGRRLIELLAMLQVKTRGNLARQEDQLLEQALGQLQMAYLQRFGAKGK